MSVTELRMPRVESWTEIVLRLPARRDEVTRLCQAFPDSRELVVTNPALAICIACSSKWDAFIEENPDQVLESLLQSKRRRVCELLGFPGTEAMVRILGKFEPEACSLPMLMRSRKVLQNEDLAHLLRHIPAISPQFLCVCLCWRWGGLASVSLFQELCGSIEVGAISPRHMMLLDDTFRMLGNRPVRPIRSIKQLEELHDRLVARLNIRREVDDAVPGYMLSRTAFPAPPFPGNSWIKPLTTPQLLAQEGREQDHCAATLVRDVGEGWLYVYKIMEPERATLSIARYENRWKIEQLYAARNLDVSPETFRMVRNWLDEQPRHEPMNSESNTSMDLMEECR